MSRAERKSSQRKDKPLQPADDAVIRLLQDRPEHLHDPSLFVNREISLLEFQRRVLDEALDTRNPLLERVRFLSIVFSNLNEFFMVRVAGLKKQQLAGVTDVPADGMTPAQQLAAIRKLATELMASARECYLEELRPALDREGIHILNYDELSKSQKRSAAQYFRDVVYPVVTPLAYDPGRPFPHISNLSLNLAVIVRDTQNLHHFARIKVPKILERFVPLKHSSGGHRKDGTTPRNHYFVLLDQVVAAHLDELFPGMDIVEVHPFHVTRDADIDIQEIEAADLLDSVEESIRKRRFGSVVRLIVNKDISDSVRDILIENLDIDPLDVYMMDGPMGMSSIGDICNIDLPDLKYPPFVPAVPVALQGLKPSQVPEKMQKQDILVHHPYDSFGVVGDFLEWAATDPNVLAIKQTLYRVGPKSPIVASLLKAVQNRKQVAVLVELKARFDEESNIEWVRQLEQEGVHVVYGLLGLKTHSKVLLVVRREGGQIRRYVHLSTGNYNHVTAQQYEDVGLLTTDEQIAEDCTDLFNYLTGYSNKTDYNKLLIAPLHMRHRFESLVRREIQHAGEGRRAHVILKTNAIVDRHIVRLLYEASQAGVEVDLLVRGICCLRPGIPGISDRIRVISVVGRFLEHSRIYYFRNAGEEEIYLGSADLMPRNLDHRVEVLFPLESSELIRYIRDDVLQAYLEDNQRARIMNFDGSYRRVTPGPEDAAVDVQRELLAVRDRSKLELL